MIYLNAFKQLTDEAVDSLYGLVKDLINKKFIDRLKKYFQLIDNGLLESSAEEIKQYKDISDLFIKSIDKKVIENYNKGIEVKKTFLPFLYLNEYV